MKYRKKPVVVEAVRWNGNNYKEVIDFAENNKIWFDALGNTWISTLEGDMIAKKGDYIIKGVQGEFYPCKPDIFAETYEELEYLNILDAIQEVIRHLDWQEQTAINYCKLL